MKIISALACLSILPICLHADLATLTATAPQGQSSSNQFVIQTNQTVQILHLRDTSSSGQLMIQKDGLSFTYRESQLNSAGNNMPTLVGPATIIVTATQSPASGWTGNILCTMSINQLNLCVTNQFTPNTGVVIPADSGGPVNIILESSVDLINWIPANPGTYGTSTTNRFFRVRATR